MTLFSSLLNLGRDVPGGGNTLQSLELPGAISPALAGVVVGAVAGVAVFLTIVLIFTRKRPACVAATATQVLFIPPYTTLARGSAPSIPAAQPAAHPSSFQQPAHAPAPMTQVMEQPAASAPAGFVPSSSLSAFAKMGYAFGARVGADVDPFDVIEERMMAEHAEALSEEDLDAAAAHSGVKPIEVSVAPVVLLTGAPRKPDSTPHPLSIIRSDSQVARVMTPPSGVSAIPVAPVVASSMIPEPEPTQIGLGLAPDPIDPPSAEPSASASGPRPRAASIESLDYDDAPTEFCEPYFDAPPQPHTRGSRPKIRKIGVAAPRFTPRRPPSQSSSSLPAVSSPPMKRWN